MIDQNQLQILAEGVERWNAWRRENPNLDISLNDADLRGAHLGGADLAGADLSGTHLGGADLLGANLAGADLSSADRGGAILAGANLSSAMIMAAFLMEANLSDANLSNAKLIVADFTEANFCDADLSYASLNASRFIDADFSGANLQHANLQHASFVNTNFTNANLEGAWVYGVSAWGLTLDGANQKNLRITPYDEPSITVDDVEVAQFIYLMLNNQKVRHVINTITTKVVLILGRFTQERKAILDAVREELRRQDYLPIIFDFEQPATRDLTETISTLAHMARFIIADITDPRSIPQCYKLSFRISPQSRCSR